MAQFLIKTDNKEKKTFIYQLGKGIKPVALIYTDFDLKNSSRDITEEEIVNAENKKAIAQILLYNENNLVTIMQKRKPLSSLSLEAEFKIEGSQVPVKKVVRAAMTNRPDYSDLEFQGLTHAYFINQSSQVFCFEKEGNLASLVYTDHEDSNSAISLLPIILAKRIEEQDYIFEFMRK